MAALFLSVLLLSMFLISALPHPLNILSHHHHHQQQLLLQFKTAVSKNGSSLPDWNPLHPFCNWTGVICHSSSHSVRAISLTQMNLYGTISPMLGNLSSLRSLDLSANNLTGTIPPQLGQLPNLWELRLTDNQLQGTIPPELGKLLNLRILSLGNNNLQGTISPLLGNLSSLRLLDLYHNQLQGTIPPTLSACHSLHLLAFSYNQLHGNIPPKLSLLTSLKYLYLGKNSLKGTIPPSFKNLSALVVLDLGVNELYGPIPPELCMLTHLHTLNLFGNNLSGTIPSSLTNLSKLNELGLFDNQIRGHIPSEIGTKLSKLVLLGLWGNQLNGNIPYSLGNCSRLKELYLNTNQLGGTVPMELGKLKLLTKVYLHTNQLVSDSSNTLAFVIALTNCSHLQEVDVKINYFTGMLPPTIGELSSNLNYLTLSANMISGSIPKQIANLTNLTYLGLDNNLFSGNIPSGIKRFRVLEQLDLGGNKLEGSIPSEISHMQYLGLLNLSHNQLSGKIPDSLCSSQQLRRLLLQHNKLSGDISISLEGCQKLELLDVSYNKLGGRIPGEVIASLKNLQFYLNLSWNSLEGSLPQEMSKIAMAQAIDISGNKLNGVIPISLGDCTALEHLNLSHNAFEGPIPQSLSKLKNLQEMDLSFNNLSGQIPEGGLFPNRTVVTLFIGNLGLCGPKNYSLPPCPNLSQGKHSLLKKVVLSVVGTIGFVLCCFIIAILWRHKLSRQLVRSSSFIFQGNYPKFSYQDLVIATSGFDESNLLGVGNFGSVYKGILRDGKIIAIKNLNLQNEEALKSFKRECKMLGRIRHRNLIRIMSAFFYPDLKGLVLEFACNGSLEKHLHTERDDEDFCKLGLSECLSIALDVAHGMEYLHHDCPLQIVHCDLKPSNVLLDANMTALVTDFGISRLTSTNSTDSLSTTTFALKGSIGYIAPEYGLGANVSIKGDVYSFGILILEMVTRKRPSDDMFVGDMSLQNWVRSAFPNRLAEIVDSELLRDVNENMEDNECLISFIHAGLLCSSESPRERPSLRDVAKGLERLKTSLMGVAAASNLTATISELLDNANPKGPLASDSQSSTF
ncbi:probable LRR receptor-like serine/threonine-protein kinase At3g47570 [Cryptomeria japonica]|uniref:probable LRR receptor-like serine/threonine-protein kinase At3g47570 n=1 Tax=Cryptomeria japonica TaxID=3369 RepID=UPI0025ABF465|nr:probable LRR receptor-like serine/threonine-protein kinase At3g47570 [Cryptomeria japonica]